MDPGTRLHSSLLPPIASGNMFLTPRLGAQWVPGNEAPVGSHWATLHSFLSPSPCFAVPHWGGVQGRELPLAAPMEHISPTTDGHNPGLVFVLVYSLEQASKTKATEGMGWDLGNFKTAEQDSMIG